MKKTLGWVAALAALVACVALVLYLSGIVAITMTNDDPRPKGGLQHVQALRYRDDVNVLFILTDTLRADRLSAYGYARETSPTFDYMASRGVRFARHLAQSSWTKCSMASLWTGLYPQRTGVLLSPHVTPEAALMPAEIFRDAGFRTAGIWRNGWVAPNFGFAQGFEVYERPVPKILGANVRSANPHVQLEGSDYDLLDAALEFLRIRGRERWFLYLHLMDLHQYVSDENSAIFGSRYSDIYDNSIRHSDEIVGRLLAYLAEHDLLQKTLVVMAADHGEAFGERGTEGHARSVFREETDVPFLIGFPFQLEPGVVIEARTRNIDIWPTVLDLLGLPELRDADGRSLTPLIEAAIRQKPLKDDVPGFAYLERVWGRPKNPSRPTLAVTRGSFRYVLQRGTGGPDDPTVESLFDSATDPTERQNLIESQTAILEELRQLADQYFESEPPEWAGTPVSVELDESEAEELRALGYAIP